MDLLISFDGLKAGTAALKKLVQAFTRAGSPVATSDLDPRTRRTLGVNYRVVDLTMTDNQKVSLGVKSTGDIYEVKVNGQALPITAQNDQRKAVGEIVKALDAGRAKHQAKLARQKVALPKGITTAAPRMEQKLAQASADLDAQIATAKARVNELRTELGEPVLDGAVVLDSASLQGMIGKPAHDEDGHVLGNVTGIREEGPHYAIALDTGREVVARNALDAGDFLDVIAPVETRVLDAITIPRASELSDAAREVLGQIDNSGSVFDGDLVSKSGRDELVERGLVERVDGDNQLTAKGKGCAATLDSVSAEFMALDAVPFQGMKRTAFASGLTDDAGEAIRVKFALSDGAVWEVRDIGAFKTKIRADSTAVAFRALQTAKQYRKVTSIGVLDAVDVPTNSFDDARVAEAQMIVDQLEAGAALDKADFSHALATLQIALDTVETNLPINLAEGDIEQANLEEKAADSFRAAITLLQDQQAPAT